MVPGQRMVFREGRTKAVGNVVRIFTNTSNVQLGNKAKQSKNQQRYFPPAQNSRPVSSVSTIAHNNLNQVTQYYIHI